MKEIAVEVENLGKRYRLGETKYNTLRDSLSGLFRGRREDKVEEILWALKEVSFTVEAGEVFGIIGRNGAGKSTLLKILSRITEPSHGMVKMNGRVGSLLEVGTGFHPELSGKENIFLNGAILGMSKMEVARKYDDIVAFSEIERFIDTPIKHYSSGMHVRLAFAVAAHLEPEILLIDEVLAVGDAEFQRKCLGKMSSVVRGGRTILFVSHNLAAITQLSHRVAWIDGGQVRLIGPPHDVVAAYLQSGTAGFGQKSWSEGDRPGDEDVRLTGVRLCSEDGRLDNSFEVNESFYIEVSYIVLRKVQNLCISLQLTTTEGMVLLHSTDTNRNETTERLPGEYSSRCVIPPFLLNESELFVSVVADVPFIKIIFQEDQVVALRLVRAHTPGKLRADERAGYIYPSMQWVIERRQQGEPQR
ncbi:MAG: ABC transporter ATP-binding protein [Candidatus Obscuribacterales bacterium]|nr:ABC transporter ATP-binding protein [Candidatus Obscuribacterales bacterium]